MRRVLFTTLLAGAAFAPLAPASATHCEFEYKDVKVCVCLTVNAVYHEVTGENLGCA